MTSSSYRAVSTENLLALPEEAFAPLLPRPRIVMGDSGDSGDDYFPPGQYLNLIQDGGPGGTRSVPDIEMHASRPDDSGCVSRHRQRHLAGQQMRCSCHQLQRAPSRDSVRSAHNTDVLVVAPSSYRWVGTLLVVASSSYRWVGTLLVVASFLVQVSRDPPRGGPFLVQVSMGGPRPC